ncbi:MAG: hypothetical protein ACREQ4_14515 [Candidatus Binataceae bacterium]
MPLSGKPIGSDLPPEQARLDMALVGLQVGRLYADQVQLLSDVTRRRAAGTLKSWERTFLERFEDAGVHVPEDPSSLRPSPGA